MPPISMDTTNAWLAVMAIAIVVQTLLMIGLVVVGWRAIGQASEAVKALEARHLVPLSARVHAVADDVQEVMSRVRSADDAIRAQLGRFDSVAHVAGQAISAKAWPVIGLSRALGAAFRAFSSRGTTRPSSPGTPHVAGATTR
jgi:hypothetical protein